MPLRSYNDFLYHTSLERVAHGRTSQATSDQLLERARATLERSRVQVARQVSAEPASCAYAEPETEPAAVLEERQAPELIELVSGRRFEGELVVLDGKHFVDCILSDCTLEYSGFPVVLESTQFAGCRFQFQGHAAMTLQLMECLGYAGENTPAAPGKGKGAGTSSRPN